MKNILLTGGLGYIGSYFVDNYSDTFNIKIIDTNYFQNKYKENSLFDSTVEKDIREILSKDIGNAD